MTNGSVRANAAALLIDVFPLQSNENSAQLTDELLQTQFDAFKVVTAGFVRISSQMLDGI